MGFLAGCTSGLQAIGESLRYAATPDQRVTRASLDPKFEYLRVRVNGRLALLVLGAVDEHETDMPVQVFYSGEGETLKLQGGRISAFTSTNQSVQIRVLAPKEAVWNFFSSSSYKRQVDSRPDYRFSQIQRIDVERLPAAPGRRDLEGLNPQELVWFKETIQGVSPSQPPALFALKRVNNRFEVVYSEECFAPDLCLSLQRWRASGAY